MQYTKSMIDLVRQLRKQLQAELGIKIRISDPELLSHLCDHYRQSANSATKALIKELLQQAGGNWFDKLVAPEGSTADTKLYRGQARVVDGQKPATKVRIYRGQVVS